MVCLAPFFAKVVSVRCVFFIRCGGGVLKGRIGNFAGTFSANFQKKKGFPKKVFFASEDISIKGKPFEIYFLSCVNSSALVNAEL